MQPGASLYGLQFSNPVDPAVGYRGPASAYGTVKDPMVGGRIGGINVFGGGLALYAPGQKVVGAVGLSGDTSCADHAIGWKTRFFLNLANVPAGVAPGGTDNIIYDIDGGGVSASGFGHPHCLDAVAEDAVANDLPVSFPVGPPTA